MSSQLRVLVYKEGRFLKSICLEYGFVGTGERLSDCIASLKADFASAAMDNLLYRMPIRKKSPAGKQYHKMYEKATPLPHCSRKQLSVRAFNYDENVWNHFQYPYIKERQCGKMTPAGRAESPYIDYFGRFNFWRGGPSFLRRFWILLTLRIEPSDRDSKGRYRP